MNKDKRKNIRFHYFLILYLVLCNMLSILLINNKGAKYDSIWKVCVLSFAIFYCIYKAIKFNIKINKTNLHIWILFIIFNSVVYILNGTLLNNLSISNITSYLYPIIFYFLLCVVFGNIDINDKCFEEFLNLFICFIVYMCIFNIIYNFRLIIEFKNIINGYQLNISSFFDNRNTFALYLMYGIVGTLIMLFYYKKKKMIYIFILFLFIFNLILTLSRTMIAGSLIFAFLLLIMSKEIKKSKLVKLFIVAIVVILISSPQLLNFFNRFIIRRESGLSSRDIIWKYGINRYIEGNIFVGNGLNNEHDILKTKYNLGSFHNTYLSILLEGGIVLGIMHAILLINAFKQIFELKKFNKKLFIIFISIACVHILSGMTETRISFESSSSSFLGTTFVYLLPMYLSNYYKKQEFKQEEIEHEKNN